MRSINRYFLGSDLFVSQNLLFWGVGACRVFPGCREWGQSWGALMSTACLVSGLFSPLAVGEPERASVLCVFCNCVSALSFSSRQGGLQQGRAMGLFIRQNLTSCLGSAADSLHNPGKSSSFWALGTPDVRGKGQTSLMAPNSLLYKNPISFSHVCRTFHRYWQSLCFCFLCYGLCDGCFYFL